MAGRGEAADVKARRSAGRATDREVVVVAAVLAAGSDKRLPTASACRTRA